MTQTPGGALKVGGATTVTATAGAIDLQSTANDFTGNVDLTATTGAAVQTLHDLVLSASAPNSITAIAGGSLNLTSPGGAITTAGGPIDLQALGGSLDDPGQPHERGRRDHAHRRHRPHGAAQPGLGNGAIALTAAERPACRSSTGKSIDAGSGTIAIDGGLGPIQLNGSTLTTSNATASAITLHHATTVAIGNVSATSGTLQVGVGADVAGAVTQNAATSIAVDTLAASTAAPSISVALLPSRHPTSARSRTAVRSRSTIVGLTLTGDMASAAAPVTLTSAGALVLGTHGIATSGANNLVLNAVGISQTTGAIVVGGTTSVNANSGRSRWPHRRTISTERSRSSAAQPPGTVSIGDAMR